MAKKRIPKTNILDYVNIVLPKPLNEQTDHSNYTATERRAEMLRIALAQGHFDLPVLKLAKLYGVSHGRISQDKDVIQEYTATKYWKPVKVISEAVAAQQKALRESIKAAQWRDVSRISEAIMDLCYNLGLVDKQADRIEAKIEGALMLDDIKNAVLQRQKQAKPKG